MATDLKFRKAKQNRIFQDVVDQIQEAILQGTLNPGDTLPPERELKEMFKTSRGTLREALRVLEQKGLIEIKVGVGGGAIVKSVSSDPISESLALLIRSQSVSLQHLAEFREGMEGSVAALAAERAKPSDVKHLYKLLDRARRHYDAGEGSWKPFLEVDQIIHREIAKISQNPVYIFVQETVHNNIQKYFEQYLYDTSEKRNLEENFQDLIDIIQAIEQGDAALARVLIKTHVRRFNDHMESRAKQQQQSLKRGGQSNSDRSAR